MTTPRTAVHASGARRRPPARVAGTRRKRPVRRTPPRRRRVATGSRRRTRPPKKGVVTKDLQRWWPALLIAAAVLAGLAWDTEYSEAAPAVRSPGVPAGHCTIAGSDLTLTTEMYTNARTITQVAIDRGLPARAVVIALATAQQESRLRNLNYGDRDSLGLFQQRPSSGWGSPAQVRDPVYAANKFYDGLLEVPGWDTARLTDAAQRVQRSAFPEAYQQWEPMAQRWAGAILSGRQGAVVCGPDSDG